MRGREPSLLLVVALLAAACGVGCEGGLMEISGGVGVAGDPALPSVIFLTSSPPAALPAEEAAAWAWLDGLDGEDFNVRQVQMIDLPGTDLGRNEVIWWHYAAEEALPSIAVRPDTLQAVRDHLRGGGTALLTLVAASYVVPLGIEPSPPDTVTMDAGFASESELGGLQSRRGHALLDFFWGGVFTSANSSFPPRAAVAYSGDRWPQNGRVWAMHKSERGVDTTTKVGIEYPSTFVGGGGVLTLGAHFYFADADNHNRPHLERLATDALRYLGARAASDAAGAGVIVPVADEPEAMDGDAIYWTPPIPSASHYEAVEMPPTSLPPLADTEVAVNMVEGSPSGPEIVRYPNVEMPFTLASPQAVAVGSQLGRVDTFRVHPQLLLRGLRFGIVRPDRGVTWLDDPESGDRTFTVRPEGVVLFYNDGELDLRLYLTVDRRYSALVGLLVLRSPASVEVIATWEAQHEPSRARASTQAGNPQIGWDAGAQAVVWRDGTGFAVKAGFGRETQTYILGFRPDEHLNEAGLFVPLRPPEDGVERPGPVSSDASRVALQVHVETTPPRSSLLPIVIVGGPEAELNIDAAFEELIGAPGRAWADNADYYRDFLDRRTMGLQVPGNGFLKAFEWAKVGIEALRTTLPNAGSGMISGFGSLDPADAWVATPNAFGSGALWAAMAADAYGDRALAAETLRLAARYQGVDGRMPTSTGAAQEVIANRIADTALFLIALENHVRAWGDEDLLAELWPAAQRAVGYLYGADPEDDGLVNGFGELDRWSSDPIVQTTIHLAGLWGAALDATTSLAEIAGEDDDATRAREAAARVRMILRDEFFDPAERRFNFAKRVDGSFVGTRTVLPAVPMIFGLLDPGIVIPALDSFSSAALSRDWGVGLLSTAPPPETPANEIASIPMPPPTGLPTVAAGLVSPVFTGWAALAEYANHRPDAGFAHTYTNLLLLEQANPGYATAAFDEQVLAPLGGAAHAAAAQAMTVLPVVWGMLGIRPDAPNNRVSISPHLPANWGRVNVDRVRVGNSQFRLQVRQGVDRIQFQVDRWSGDRDIDLRFSTHVPIDVNVALDPNVVGAEIVDEPTVEQRSPDRLATVVVRPTADLTTITFVHDPFPRLISPIPDRLTEARTYLQPGASSSGLRVIEAHYSGGVMDIELEGLPGRTYTLRFTTPWRVSQVTGLPNLQPAYPDAGIVTIDVTIPGSGPRYRPVSLQVAFER